MITKLGAFYKAYNEAFEKVAALRDGVEDELTALFEGRMQDKSYLERRHGKGHPPFIIGTVPAAMHAALLADAGYAGTTGTDTNFVMGKNDLPHEYNSHIDPVRNAPGTYLSPRDAARLIAALGEAISEDGALKHQPADGNAGGVVGWVDDRELSDKHVQLPVGRVPFGLMYVKPGDDVRLHTAFAKERRKIPSPKKKG